MEVEVFSVFVQTTDMWVKVLFSVFVGVEKATVVDGVRVEFKIPFFVSVNGPLIEMNFLLWSNF